MNEHVPRPDSSELLATIDGELRKVAASVDSDAVILVDMRQNTLAAAGPMGERFPRGGAVSLGSGKDGTFDRIAHQDGAVFRVRRRLVAA